MIRRLLAAAIIAGSMITPWPATAGGDPAFMTLRGWGHGPGHDVLKANAISAYAGEVVRLFRKEDGAWVLIRERLLDDHGNARFDVDDHNDASLTKYLAKVRPTDAGLPRQRAVVRVH